MWPPLKNRIGLLIFKQHTVESVMLYAISVVRISTTDQRHSPTDMQDEEAGGGHLKQPDQAISVKISWRQPEEQCFYCHL